MANIVRAQELVRCDIPHLSVVVEDASITCGPWVEPGASPCLRCVALRRSADDPGWPAMATQRNSRSAVAARGEDQALAAATGSFAAAQAVAALTGVAPSCVGASVRFRLPDFATERVEWDSQPECG
ncbi:MAG: TOMM precursor leader peptide-binding protein, partial [Bifidobacteriaceae bacterium]|nr:TOMM precursor leader peptide-binding protein [Bifidobacteriaceae bacterium]